MTETDRDKLAVALGAKMHRAFQHRDYMREHGKWDATIPAFTAGSIADWVTELGWTPPPTGDVIAAAQDAIFDEFGDDYSFALAGRAARAVADAGYLATPAQQDTEAPGRSLASETKDRPGEVIETLDQEWLSIPIPPDDGTVERVARAIWMQDAASDANNWADVRGRYRDGYVRQARDAIRALSGEVGTDG